MRDYDGDTKAAGERLSRIERAMLERDASKVWICAPRFDTNPPSREVHSRRPRLSSGAAATDGTAWMRGRMPTARLRTCQPLIWNIRCTVFLLKPRSQATVR
ncbi:hypothetical protein [Salipiger profundus]|uniref:hypothetical protein n=1 Tax=Salipiger profundus TaxID=1229727 RepID=UPI00227C887E|nr:hypothetical protein [Salipiger profundus]